ncbi:ABC transporter ATP-binding protein [Sulfitobacter sp.]|uniref:ABC transporter ATP-binding protein n=1 Tax=Sulfitobacter sp. TaxID=1903071 RepID=UPI003298F333
MDIRCNQVAKRFGDLETVAPMTLTFSAGQTTALVGPSGCGKSTLLRMIAGLEQPSQGAIHIGEQTPRALAKRGGLAMAFQDASLLPWRSVRANIALGATLARKPSGAVDDLISLVGLEGFEDARPAALSGGMRQRVAIARALVSDPDVLLLDEPFASVDAITRARLNAELPALWRDTTTVLVTHSVIEAVLLSDRVIVLSRRPAQITLDISVTLDGPRDEAMTRTQPFKDLCDRVLVALEDNG